MRQTKSKSLLLALVLMVLVVMGQQTEMYLCGTELNEALSTMCGRHGYNRMLKRSFDPTDYNDIEAGFGLARMDFDDDRSLLHRMFGESAAQLMKTRRRRVGVSDECCLKPCSLGELLNYCAKPPGQYGN